MSRLEDLLRPFIDVVLKLAEQQKKDRLVGRLGAVASTSPLRVALDGDIDMDEDSPTFGQPILTPAISMVSGLTSGMRIYCLEQHRRVTVIQALAL